MSKANPWRGEGMEWGDPREKPCRPHEWVTLEVGPDPEQVGDDILAVCRICHVRQCFAHNRSGRCQIAVHHPQGTFHRYPDLESEPVSGRMLDPRQIKRKGPRKSPPAPA